MSLDLTKSEIYADPYATNGHYIENMTSLQMKALEEMEWNKAPEYIDTGLWSVPWVWSNEENAKYSMNVFIKDLNRELRGL